MLHDVACANALVFLLLSSLVRGAETGEVTDRAFLIPSTIFAIATFVLLLLLLSVHSCSEMQVLHAIQLFAMHVIQDRNFFEVYK